MREGQTDFMSTVIGLRKRFLIGWWNMRTEGYRGLQNTNLAKNPPLSDILGVIEAR